MPLLRDLVETLHLWLTLSQEPQKKNKGIGHSGSVQTSVTKPKIFSLTSASTEQARTRLIPSVQEFVRLHAHTTLGIPNALSQFEANNLSHDYSLNLNDIYFTSPLPAYPGIGGIPIPVSRSVFSSFLAELNVGLLQRVEIRIPGIALNTSTVGSDLVRVPAPPPFTGLQKVHPPRRGLMFLPSNSTSGRSIEVRAGPRVFEFYEHSWQHAGGLLKTCPIQCRGQEGTLGNLQDGLFSNPFHHQRWTYRESILSFLQR